MSVKFLYEWFPLNKTPLLEISEHCVMDDSYISVYVCVYKRVGMLTGTWRKGWKDVHYGYLREHSRSRE